MIIENKYRRVWVRAFQRKYNPNYTKKENIGGKKKTILYKDKNRKEKEANLINK